MWGDGNGSILETRREKKLFDVQKNEFFKFSLNNTQYFIWDFLLIFCPENVCIFSPMPSLTLLSDKVFNLGFGGAKSPQNPRRFMHFLLRMIGKEYSIQARTTKGGGHIFETFTRYTHQILLKFKYS